MTEPQVPGKKPFLYVVVCAAGVMRRPRQADHGRSRGKLGRRRGGHSAGPGFHRHGGGRGPDRLPDPLGLALTRRSSPVAARRRDRGGATTFNTVNKWAAGISDTLALGILCESYGMGIPTAVLPYVNSAQAAHPAYRQSLERLREMDVLIGSYEPHRPKAAWRGRPLPLGRGAGTAHFQGVHAAVISAAVLVAAAALEGLPPVGQELPGVV